MKTKRLVLSKIEIDHAKAFRSIMSDPEMGRHTDVPCAPTEKRSIGFVAWMMRLNSTGKGRAWALCHHNTVIGFIRLNKIDKRWSFAVVGYEIARPFWGRGLMSEALQKLVIYAHEEMKLHRLEAGVFNGNDASTRVLEKAGFKKEGIQRSRLVHNNERRDLLLFGRLSSDPK